MRTSILVAASAIVLSGVALADVSAPQFLTLDHNDMLSSNVVGLDVYDMSNKTSIGKISRCGLRRLQERQGICAIGRRVSRHGHALCRGRHVLRRGQI